MRETDSDSGPTTRAAARDVLEYILRLELPEARWERLGVIIDLAIDAEAAGDLDGLAQATIELELAGPVRVIRIGPGSAQPVPPPPKVRERANQLIESVSVKDRDKDKDKGDKKR